jgi:hypothetical protein
VVRNTPNVTGFIGIDDANADRLQEIDQMKNDGRF